MCSSDLKCAREFVGEGTQENSDASCGSREGGVSIAWEEFVVGGVGREAGNDEVRGWACFIGVAARLL